MIILELLVFLITIIFLSLSFSGIGSLINFNTKSDFLINIFFGFIAVSMFVTFIHFFFKINFFISGSIFLLGIILVLWKKNSLILLKKKIFNIIFSRNIFTFTNFYISKIP